MRVVCTIGAPEPPDNDGPGAVAASDIVSLALGRATTDGPLALILDDLHSASAAMLASLAAATRCLPAIPAFVLGTCVEPVPRAEAKRIAELEEEAVRVRLGPCRSPR
jgi:hypothetical protein